MGVYLSSPITTKESSDQTHGNFTYGVSSMQGWRMSQEDAHNCIPDLDPGTNTSMFAVYDGHGGAEVAKYCSQYLPDFIKGVELYKEGKLGDGLQEAFLGFDAVLTQEKVIQQLKEMAGVDDDDEEDDDDEPGGRNETDMLVAEANMPIEELMAKYSSDGPPQTPAMKRLQEKKTSSPMLRAKKEGAVEKGSEGNKNNSNSAEAQASISEDKLENGQPDNDNNLNVEKELREAEVKDVDDTVNKSNSASSDNTNNNEKAVKTDENSIKKDQDKKDIVNSCEKINNGQKTVDADSTTDENHVVKSENVSSSSSAEVSTTTSEPIQSSSLSSSSSSSGEPEAAGSSGVSDSKPSGSGCSSSVEPAGSSSGPSSSSAGSSGCSSAGPSSSGAGPSGSGMAGPYGSGVQAGGSGSGSKEKKTIADEEFDSDDDSSEEEEEYMEDSDEDDDEDDDEDEEDEVEGPLSGVFGRRVINAEEEEDHNEEPGSDSGCTAVVALLRDNHLVVANAGDSRCVLCRDGTAVDLSVDHKPEDDLERNRIEEAGGKVTSDGRVNGGLNLSRAIGDHWYKRNETKEPKDQMISAFPDVEQATLSSMDEFMVIACDGIWNYMTSQEVVDFVKEKLRDPAKKKTPSLICEEMFDHCLAPNTMGDGTGCDNMTCIIVVFNQPQTSSKRDKSQLDTSASDEQQPEKRARLEEKDSAAEAAVEKEPTVEVEKESIAEEATVEAGKESTVEEATAENESTVEEVAAT